jgi:hypothetical protein
MNNNVSFVYFIENIKTENKNYKWYLEWNADKKSKDYGLNILCEEIGDTNKVLNITRQIFLTSDIELRGKYVKYLIPFIEEFKNHLINLCSLENNE